MHQTDRHGNDVKCLQERQKTKEEWNTRQELEKVIKHKTMKKSLLATLEVTFSAEWKDFVSDTPGFFGKSLSARTEEQLVLRKSNVAELAVRSRLRRFVFLRPFVCVLTFGGSVDRLSCFESLPTTVHFSSGFCVTFCRDPLPSVLSLLQFFLCEGLLFCCSLDFVFAATAT